MDANAIAIASHLEKSPQLCLPVDSNDAKYVSGLSTILVATIQEAKDRISQIEYIFCSQLYPNFQKNSKCLQKLYSEARRAAEEEWKERERQLEIQMEQLCHDKVQVLEECKVLKADKSKLHTRIAELEEKLFQKSKEVDDRIELHAKLLDLIESKGTIITNKDKQMKEHEERINSLLSKLEGLERSIDAVNKELQEKKEQLAKEKELKQQLLRQIESQALKITSSEQAMAYTEMEKKQLAKEQSNMVATLDDLRGQLRRKDIELEEGNKLREQLVQQVNKNGIELTNKDQQLSAHEREKKLLLSRINDLETTVQVLEKNLRDGISGISKRSEYHDELVQQIESKNAELSAERQRYKDVVAAYKKLKSEHNFLLLKLPLNKEDMLRQIKSEGESEPSCQDIPPPEIKNRTPVTNVVAGELNKVKKEIDTIESSDEQKDGRLNQSRSSPSPSSSKSPAATHWITNRKEGSSSGTKRPASGWRATRSRQSPGGADPHDDFLDTPYENIRGNLQKAMKDNIQDIPAQVSKDMDSDSSDEETQDMQAECGLKKQQLQAPRPGSKGFKFVEPVRKQSERQNLNGIECKQCKKFYDAVCPDDAGKDGEVDKHNLRCEHHEGVSRHRYRYAPPMTPEGFWNIGFDSET